MSNSPREPCLDGVEATLRIKAHWPAVRVVAHRLTDLEVYEE
jgi:hypothetical protein